MDAKLRRLVFLRANARCEYCHFPEEFAKSPFEVDHIIAEKHGGATIPENLALSCFYCNSYKGPNIASIDPVDEVIVRLFHPRNDAWEQHFAWNGPVLVGLTSIGRATIRVMEINRPIIVETRRWLRIAGETFS